MMDYYTEEKQYKQQIAQAMGDDFVDAIFEGTTSETGRRGFLQSMFSIAYNCKQDGFIDLETALWILENYNPGKEYNGRVFQSYAQRAIESRRSYVDFQI